MAVAMTLASPRTSVATMHSASVIRIVHNFTAKLIENVTELGSIEAVCRVFSNRRDNLATVRESESVSNVLYKRFQDLKMASAEMETSLAEVPSEYRDFLTRHTHFFQKLLHCFKNSGLLTQMTCREFDQKIEKRLKTHLETFAEETHSGGAAGASFASAESAWKDYCEIFQHFKDLLDSGKYEITPQLIRLLIEKSKSFYHSNKGLLASREPGAEHGVELVDFSPYLTEEVAVVETCPEVGFEAITLDNCVTLLERVSMIRHIAELLLANPMLMYEDVVAEDSISSFVLSENERLEEILRELSYQTHTHALSPEALQVYNSLDEALRSFDSTSFAEGVEQISATRRLDDIAEYLEILIKEKNALKEADPIIVAASKAQVENVWAAYSDALAEYVVAFDAEIEEDAFRSARHDRLVALDSQVDASA